jgi:23S rRNA (uracil1939-C5)-methyltransferase
MTKKKELIIENVRLGKLVHGGQALAVESTGKKLFVWGGLSDELVHVRITKKKHKYTEGIVSQVLETSNDRIEPQEPVSYLSTSPWQIMTFDAENKQKQVILQESFSREKIAGIAWEPFIHDDRDYHYRNKQEMGFWGNESGLHLAHYVRGTHGKQQVTGSALAVSSINNAAQALQKELNRLNVWGGKLKTLMLRASQADEVVAALFVKEELDLSELKLPQALQGLIVYLSDPKSPASVPTKELYSYGDITLTDSVLGINITYDVLSFFQVNLPVFELALKEITKHVGSKPSVDFYSGVGTIGLVVGSSKLIESDTSNIKMAKKNSWDIPSEVISASSEGALDHIDARHILIVDPPRAGLHRDVINRILEVCPPKIIYLSCDPSTQARDVRHISEKYNVVHAQGFNFFPRTPHIESLIVLEFKK